LIEQVTAFAREAGFHYVGSSFGATPELLDFWTRMQWLPVRVGFQRGASSGSHSVVVLKALSGPGPALAARARERYFAQFPHQLSDSLKDLEADLVIRLMRRGASGAIAPGEADWEDARAFAFGQRLLETSIGSLRRVACFALMDARCIPALDTRQLTLLVARVLQGNSWQRCAALTAVSGRAAALAELRSAVATLIRYYSTLRSC
jgi:tRNA(Met) cytidine acetyltransferase